jgi:deoxyribodipyrimidine photolyase-related protein
MKSLIILPTQLFKNNELVDICDIIYIIEEPYYFTRFNFHKQKLVLHKASMHFYKDYLKKYNVKYITFDKVYINQLIINLQKFIFMIPLINLL